MYVPFEIPLQNIGNLYSTFTNQYNFSSFVNVESVKIGNSQFQLVLIGISKCGYVKNFLWKLTLSKTLFWRLECLLLHDDARPYFSILTLNLIRYFDWEQIGHPLYSPELAPS